MPSTYEVLKDFAGPAAAVVGAIVASVITFIFGRAQKRIAESQRDIALDKLKFDLLERRYAIYQATKQLLEHIALVRDLDSSEPGKVRSLYITLDEARFYFPPDVCGLLSQIHDASERFFIHLARREGISLDNADEWATVAEILATDQQEFRGFYAALPQKFESALSFKQLKTLR
jgi:hypothetical protein